MVKFDSAGAYQWSKRVGGANDDCVHGISIDSSDNIFAAGIVNFSADLNGDGDSTNGVYESLTHSFYDDIFIVKFNSSGIFQWAKRYFGIRDECSYSIVANSESNVYITGYIRGNIDLNSVGDTADAAESSEGFDLTEIVIIKVANKKNLKYKENLYEK